MFKPVRIFLFLAFLFIVNKSYSQFPYYESFKNSVAPGIVFGGGDNPLVDGHAYLTADPNVPWNPAVETDGDGYLRLTKALPFQRGYIYNDQIIIPSQNGLKIEFEYFTWGGTGADGICFFLYDADVLPNFKIGGFGGSLGYAQYKKDDLPTGPVHAPGVTGGYIGVGIDEFGYFARTFEGRQPFLDGTPVYSPQGGSVAIRGKGDGDALVEGNYPLLAVKKTTDLTNSFPLVGPRDQRHPNPSNLGYRKAHIILERHPSGGFYITVDITVGGVTPIRHTVIERFHYPELTPQRLGYGISSSTGNNTNYHEIRNLNIDLFEDKPIGLSDEVNTITNVAVPVNVLVNDPLYNDPPLETGIIVIQDAANPQPVNGIINIVDENTGIINYTPNPGFSGIDKFNYILHDQNTSVNSHPIEVVVKVRPVGSSDNEITPLNTPVNIPVKDNDLSKNGTNVQIKTNPVNGTIVLDPLTNEVTYTPNPGYSGTDQFTYALETPDGLESDPIIVDITVTPFVLEPAKIGLAKALVSATKNTDGSFSLLYRFTIVNTGDITVNNLSLRDDLTQTFYDAVYAVRSVTATGSLIANTAFDGSFNKELLAAGSIIGPKSKYEVDVELTVSLSKNEGTYNNTAIVTGNSAGDGSLLEDESTNGLSPDPYVPGDFSPKELTPVTLKKQGLYIPEGFSPNNDGINDRFVIENASGKPLKLEIYNRWGNVVYKSADYQNDWTGVCTEGIHFGEDVPSGTYYYVVSVDDQKMVGFITLNR